jgi:putative phosphoesterase
VTSARTDAAIGVISDTHGLVRPEALAALAGVAQVVHAGDVGDAAVLEALSRIAPVTAVRGNNDHGAWADRLPERATLAVAGIRVLVVHEHSGVRAADVAGFDVLVSGHSHRPRIGSHGGVLHVNPGSAGPRRFTLPIAVARLEVADGRVEARIVELTPS